MYEMSFSDMWKTCCRGRLRELLKPVFLDSQPQRAAALLTYYSAAFTGTVHITKHIPGLGILFDYTLT